MRALEPACFFALEVTRRPAPDLVTCLGGGYVASGATGPDKAPLPWLPRGLALLPMEMAGEVQTPLRVPRGTSIALGDPVVFRHAKAGELAERFREYLLLEGGRVVERVPTYRGQGECFL
jgi:D-serine deaminase-like pyridoxal phosphate-dependent protein